MVREDFLPVANDLMRHFSEFNGLCNNLRIINPRAQKMFNTFFFQRVDKCSGSDSISKMIKFCDEWILLNNNASLIIVMEALLPLNAFLAKSKIKQIATIMETLSEKEYSRQELVDAVETHMKEAREVNKEHNCLICEYLSPFTSNDIDQSQPQMAQQTSVISKERQTLEAESPQKVNNKRFKVVMLYKDPNIPTVGRHFNPLLRKDAISNIVVCLRRCCADLKNWQALFVDGEAGVGKTSLVSHIIKEADQYFLVEDCQVIIVIWINAFEMSKNFEKGGRLLFKAISDHLKEALMRQPELQKIIGDLQSVDSDYLQWLRNVSLILDGMNQRVLVVVDDANAVEIPRSVCSLGPGFRLAAISGNSSLQTYNTDIISRDNTFQVKRMSNEEATKIIFGQEADFKNLCVDFRNLVLASEGLPFAANTIEHELIKHSESQLAMILFARTMISEVAKMKIKDKMGAKSDVAGIIQIPVDALEPTIRQLFWRLLFFAEGQPIDADDLALVWNAHMSEVTSICTILMTHNLIELQPNVTDRQSPDQNAAKKVYFTIHSLRREAALRSALQDSRYIEVKTIDEWRKKFICDEMPTFRHSECGNIIQSCIERNAFSLLETICKYITPEVLSTLLFLDKDSVEEPGTLPPLLALVKMPQFASWRLLSMFCEKLLSHAQQASVIKSNDSWHKFMLHCIKFLTVKKKFVDRLDDNLIIVAAQQNCPNFCEVIISELKQQKPNVPNLVKDVINYANRRSRTALHLVAAEGFTSIAKMLLSEGANFDDGDDAGITPLGHAAIRGKHEIVKMLLEKGANPDRYYHNWQTPRISASMHNQQKVAKLFATVDPVKYIDNDYAAKYPMHQKVIDDDLDELLKVTNLDDLFFCEDNKLGSNLFQLLAMTGRQSGVMHILGLKPGLEMINRCDRKKATALFRALDAEGEHLEIVKLLVKSGVAVDTPAHNGAIPLHVAAIRGHVGIAEYLLSLPDAEKRYRARTTPDFNWCTPLHSASRFGKSSSVVEVLLNYSKSRNSVPTQPEDDYINGKDINGWTPLHYACHYVKPEAARVLIANGANLHARDHSGKKPVELIPHEWKRQAFPAKTFGVFYNY